MGNLKSFLSSGFFVFSSLFFQARGQTVEDFTNNFVGEGIPMVIENLDNDENGVIDSYSFWTGIQGGITKYTYLDWDYEGKIDLFVTESYNEGKISTRIEKYSRPKSKKELFMLDYLKKFKLGRTHNGCGNDYFRDNIQDYLEN